MVPLCSYLLVLAQAVLYPQLYSTLHNFPYLLGMHSHIAAAEQIPNNINPFALEGNPNISYNPNLNRVR